MLIHMVHVPLDKGKIYSFFHSLINSFIHSHIHLFATKMQEYINT